MIYTDHELTNTIILTLHYFLESKQEFLSLLKKRLSLVVQKYKNPKDPNVVKMTLKVVNMMKICVEQHLGDFTDDSNLVNQFKSFAKEEIGDILPSAVKNFTNFVDSKCGM